VTFNICEIFILYFTYLQVLLLCLEKVSLRDEESSRQQAVTVPVKMIGFDMCPEADLDYINVLESPRLCRLFCVFFSHLGYLVKLYSRKMTEAYVESIKVLLMFYYLVVRVIITVP